MKIKSFVQKDIFTIPDLGKLDQQIKIEKSDGKVFYIPVHDILVIADIINNRNILELQKIEYQNKIKDCF